MEISNSPKILSLENFLSGISWWAIFNSGLIAYYSHDFGFLSDLRFYFAELMILGVFMIALFDVNYSESTNKQKLSTLFLILSISTILHFQFEHSFKYFFFGQET